MSLPAYYTGQGLGPAHLIAKRARDPERGFAEEKHKLWGESKYVSR